MMALFFCYRRSTGTNLRLLANSPWCHKQTTPVPQTFVLRTRDHVMLGPRAVVILFLAKLVVVRCVECIGPHGDIEF